MCGQDPPGASKAGLTRPFPLLCRDRGNIPTPPPPRPRAPALGSPSPAGAPGGSCSTSRSCSCSRHRTRGAPLPWGHSWAPGTERDSPGWGLCPSLSADPGEEEEQSSSAEQNSRWEQPCSGAGASDRSHHHQPMPQVTPGPILDPGQSGGMAMECQEPLQSLPGSGWGFPPPLPALQLLSAPISHSGIELEVTSPFLPHHEDTSWIFGKNSKLKRRLNTGPGCQGTGGITIPGSV